MYSFRLLARLSAFYSELLTGFRSLSPIVSRASFWPEVIYKLVLSGVTRGMTLLEKSSETTIC